MTCYQGAENTSAETQQFLRKLGIVHRKTSVGFPHAAKRVIRDVLTGELDTVKLVS